MSIQENLMVDNPTIDKAASMHRIAGVDEAGRGPLAGPVYAAAVILDEGQPISGLNDSKKLTESKRELLFAEIQSKALAWAIASASVDEISELNVLQATLLAMSRAVAALQPQATAAVIDGNQMPKLTIPAQTLIGGDGIEPCISAASILAKVARDRLMRELDLMYPMYGFAKHKGYGTKAHMAALTEFGPCEHHRATYAPVIAAQKAFQFT